MKNYIYKHVEYLLELWSDDDEKKRALSDLNLLDEKTPLLVKPSGLAIALIYRNKLSEELTIKQVSKKLLSTKTLRTSDVTIKRYLELIGDTIGTK